MLIEQAIFTSAQTDWSAGYQLVAQSPGICDADLRELTLWGPSHDSLLESGVDAVSINFYPLPSGAYCVSKTTPAGSEYSGRRGPQIYTQCLVVPVEVLARFGNNPFALVKAAFAQGSLRVHERVPEGLEPFRLAGKAAAVDQALLAQLLVDPGVTWLGALIEAAVSSSAVALVAGQQRQRLIAGLMNCLPPECRTDFSFSTGLKYSPRRSFRVVCVAGDPAEQRRLLRQYDINVLELSGKPPKELTVANGWGGFVACAIATGRTSFLAAQLSQRRDGLKAAHLPKLGNLLLEAMAAEAEDSLVSAGAPPSRADRVQVPTDNAELAPVAGIAAAEIGQDEGCRRADNAHARFQTPLPATAASQSDVDLPLEPAEKLSWHCPAALERLELLDDVVFEAIAGKPGSLDQLRALWPMVLAQLGPDLIEESRQVYMHHALRAWHACVEGEQIHNPSLAVAAVEVLSLLLEEPAR